MSLRRKLGFILTVIIALFLLSAVLYLRSGEDPEWGVTYSVVYAEELGLDIEESYVAVLDELRPDALRLPVYWSRYEDAPNSFNFDELDWMMDEAAARGIPVTLVIGQKVPRWPECFIPDWHEDDVEEGLLNYLTITTLRYQDHPALNRWQVENEPFFPFGECPNPDADLLQNEITLVAELDPATPIQQTTSGEQSLWALHVAGADVLGSSLYREVSNDVTGTIIVPLKTRWYRVQALAVQLLGRTVIISELQAEPWGVHELLGENDAAQAFTAHELQQNMEFAAQTGMDEVYLWGVEWWYYLKEQGDSKLWDMGVLLMQ